MKKLALACLLFTLPIILFFSIPVKAWPEDTVTTGKPCLYCHVNESGLGPLTPAGEYFGDKRTLEGFDENQQVEKGVNFGAKVSTIVTGENKGKVGFGIKTARLALTYTIDDKTFIYVDNNLGDFRRAYFQWGKPAYNIKIGLQEVDFGFRLYDHTALVEDSLGFGLDRIDIGARLGGKVGMLSMFCGVYNGSNVKVFRPDLTGASGFNAGISIAPWDFITLAAHGYYNYDDLGGHERTLFASLAELRWWKLMYRGEYIMGRWRENLVRGYHSEFIYTPYDIGSMFISGEMLDLNRDLADNAVYRMQLGYSHKITSDISCALHYTHSWQAEDKDAGKGRTDLYIRAEY